jgi:tetratricopeptide (TPR) repeat protein
MKITFIFVFLLSSLALVAQTPPTAAAPQASAAPQPNIPPQVRQAQQLNSEGKQDEALAVLKQMLATEPDSYEANLVAGIVLDMKGDYANARTYLKRAIELAPSERRVQSLRTMAVSYAFQCDLPKVMSFEQIAAESQVNAQKLTDAAGTYNELGRIYLECGDTAGAAKWYQTGYQTAVKSLNLPQADRDLWSFRLQNAKARIAAREGNAAEANADVAAAKALLDGGKVPQNQQIFYPYLTGYVAFYAKDYKTAIEQFQKADQKDPFILVLLAQAHEKIGNQPEAIKYYREVLTINSHTPTNAFARPLAKKKLGMTG